VEAGIHAARLFLDSGTTSQALLKLDFVNAFNTVHRDSFMEAVAENLPELMAHVLSSYECPTSLAARQFRCAAKGTVLNAALLGQN